MNLPGYDASRLSLFLMGQQAITGFQFDKEAAQHLLVEIDKQMRAIEEEVEPQLPPRPLKKGEQAEYTIPAKPFKKDGTLSAVMLRFMEKHGLKLIGLNHIQWQGELVKIEGGKLLPATAKMTLSDQKALKNWFLSEGWEPTLWNFKKGERGKPLRDDRGNLIRTSPKFHEKGVLCPNLEVMEGSLVRRVITYLSYSNRRSVLESTSDEEKGWLNNPRLDIDGRLSASATGISNTHRYKHSVICNVPKAEDGVLLGKEMRSLFIARPGHVLVGYDASALEARVEAHYTKPFPGGEDYARELIEGDIHMKTVERVFADKVASVLGTDDFHKDHPLVKPWRSKSKQIRYGIVYGCSASKLAKMLNVSQKEGERIYEAFWEASAPLKMFKDKVEAFWEQKGEKKWIVGLDGRRVYTRSKHTLRNALFQSGGAIGMEYAGLFMNKWLGGIARDVDGAPAYLYRGLYVYRVGYFHDEYLWECPPEVADEIGALGVKSIRQAGEYLKMRVALDGEYKVGTSWKETH